MPDWWTAFQFDSAVSYFGIWVENKLNDYDYQSKPPRPKHRLEDLLKDGPISAPPLLTGRGVSNNLSGIRRAKRNKKGG